MSPIYRRTLFVLAIAAMPAVAAAEDAFTLQHTDIFAGPSSDYPQIATLPPNTEVGVAGCLSDWSWCDVTFANDRGWVWAGDLGYPYQSQRVVIIDNGPRLHIPVVTFSINAYWDAHYRSRPFFRERETWVSRVHVEGGHGGKPPHGGTRVAQPSSGGATAQRQAHAQSGAQAQAERQQPRAPQGAQAEQRSREQAQTEQRTREQAQSQSRSNEKSAQADRSREQAKQAQAARSQPTEGTRPKEDVAKSPQRPQPQASQSMQAEQHAQASDQRAGSRGMAQEQHEAGGASRGPDRSASAKGERPKEEGREAQQ